MNAAPARVAGEADLEEVTETLWLAFREDPLWSWAFPDHAALGSWWRFLIAAALGHEWVWVSGDFAAASVWIPPGREELSGQQQLEAEDLLGELLGERRSEVSELMNRFGAAHPEGEPHFYLSLLGTHPDHRGKGLGMELLAQNLALIDERRAAAYLESSNARNVPGYERLGFEVAGAFTTPDDARSVTTMWRAPAGRA